MFTNGFNLNSALPAQQVSYKIKFEEEVDGYGNSKWMKDNMDALEAIGVRFIYKNSLVLRKNYEIMEGRFNIEDYVDTFETYDLASAVYQELKLPSFLKHYDITSKVVKLLVGEFLKRPDILKVIAEDDESTNEKIRVKNDLLKQYLTTSIQQEVLGKLMQMGIDPNKSDFQSEEEASQYKQFIEEKYKELTPDNIERYLMYDFKTAGESWGQAVLSIDKQRFNLREQDMIEFQHMCISDRAFSHIFITPSGYKVESWNPLETFYQYSSSLRKLEEGAYIGRVMYMPKTMVIDLFGWRMKEEQIQALYPENKSEGKQGDVYKEAFNATMYPFPDYRNWQTMSMVQNAGMIQEENSNFLSPSPFNTNSRYFFNQTDLVQLTQAYWKSQRKVGKLILQDPETGKTYVKIVPEQFDPKLFKAKVVKESYFDTNEPNTICWTWITETWQGIKINVNHSIKNPNEDRMGLYIDIKPCEFQFRGNDPKFMFDSKLPVIGEVFNSLNGASQSVVDLIKPYQIMVNAFYNQAYHVAQNNNGKIALIGASLLPSNKDWGGEEALEKFTTIANSLGFAVVDDTDPRSVQSMQYSGKVLDLDQTDRVQKNINIAMLVEQQGLLQLGITPQRQGQIQASETATGTTTAVTNSYAITEIYFEKFANYRKRKLTAMLEMAQYVMTKDEEGDITLSYNTTDFGKAFLKLNANEIMLKTLGVYINNSAEEQRKKDIVEQLILKNNQSSMPLSKLIEIIKLDNLSDIQKKLEESEAVQQKQAQTNQEQAIQLEQQKIKVEAEEKQKDRDLKKYEIDTKARIEVQKVTLQGIANEGSFNPDVDKTEQLMKQSEIALNSTKINSDIFNKQQENLNKRIEAINKHKLEKSKFDFEKDLQKQTLKLKQKELDTKAKIEDKKLQQIITQNESQEKIAKLNIEKEKDLANKKLQIEKQKIKIKPKLKK